MSKRIVKLRHVCIQPVKISLQASFCNPLHVCFIGYACPSYTIALKDFVRTEQCNTVLPSHASDYQSWMYLYYLF